MTDFPSFEWRILMFVNCHSCDLTYILQGHCALSVGEHEAFSTMISSGIYILEWMGIAQ
jgi:hypothetical protein